MKTAIHIAHSPDSDDVFMFYALAHGKVASNEFAFEVVQKDIEQLNRLAPQEIYDITALSVHTYAHVSDRYYLTLSGASMAEEGEGPVVVAKRPHQSNEIEDLHVAVPGTGTTAFLILKMIVPWARFTVMPFDQILPAVAEGKVPAGLLIHESQLQYKDKGLEKIVSLRDFWKAHHGDLPLPLGVNAVKKSLGRERAHKLSRLQAQSIRYALDHRDELLKYLQSLNPHLSKKEIQTYLSWYANRRTLNMGRDGLKAIELLFDMAYDAKILSKRTNFESI